VPLPLLRSNNGVVTCLRSTNGVDGSSQGRLAVIRWPASNVACLNDSSLWHAQADQLSKKKRSRCDMYHSTKRRQPRAQPGPGIKQIPIRPPSHANAMLLELTLRPASAITVGPFSYQAAAWLPQVVPQNMMTA